MNTSDPTAQNNLRLASECVQRLCTMSGIEEDLDLDTPSRSSWRSLLAWPPQHGLGSECPGCRYSS